MNGESVKAKASFNVPEFIMGFSVGALFVISAVIYERVNSTVLEEQNQLMNEVSEVKKQLIHSEMENDLLSRELKIYRYAHAEILEQLKDVESTKKELCR